MRWTRCFQVLGVVVLAIAIAIGMGLQGYYDLEEASSPIMHVLFNKGYMDNVMLKEVSDGINPPFRTVGITQDYFNKLRSWKPRKNDVIVATFPKAGTHMMGQLVLQTLNDGQLNFSTWHHYIVTLEFTNVNPQRCNDSRVLDAMNYKEVIPDRPAVIITHFPPQAVYFEGHKHVVICRHPQDVLVSFKDMLESFMGRAAPDLYGASRMLGKISHGWATYYSQWWELSQKHPNDVLFLFYEDVIADVPATIRKVANFTQHAISEEAVARATYLSGIEYMKKNAKKFDPPEPCAAVSPLFKAKTRTMINKGTAGRGRQLPEDIKHDLKIQVLGNFNLAQSSMPIDRYYKAA